MKPVVALSKSEKYRCTADIIERIESWIDTLQNQKYKEDDVGELTDSMVKWNQEYDYQISMFKDIIERL